jgi:energy-coupling factor transporter ATP-binding protein EcfA2
MIHKQLSLSDIVDYFKKNKSKDSVEILQEAYGYLLAASAIAALVVAPDPTITLGAFSTAATMSSLKMSGLLSWLSDRFKFGKKLREDVALERYEISGIANFMLFNIAIRHSFEETFIPVLQQVTDDLNLDEQEKANFLKLSVQADEKINISPVWMNVHIHKEDIANYALEIIAPLLRLLEKNQDEARKSKKNVDKLDLLKIKDKFTENAFLQYNAYLINFSIEFPEFALWVDLSLKQKMVKELNASLSQLTESDRILEQSFIKSVETIVKKIESLHDQSFCKNTGFPSLLKTYEDLFKRQSEHLLSQQNIKSRENIQAHQNQIKAELDKPLIDNDDVDDIVYPKIKDIYISQGFEAITYHKKRHGRAFLSPEFWQKNAKNGENIGNELLETLVDPNYCGRPIIILGNPGAGKSMLSKMFAGALAETTDFIPFLIKLRNVATGTTNISEHIAKGLSKSIENINDINWIDWAKEFRDRIPVIILDGFDELMRFSQSELNNYLNAIKEFQETALSHGICTRVILTSRIAVMQDVSIPEHTRIIKLKGFDQARKALWISIWNQHQKKEGYQFVLPENDNIQQLAQEPLLLFMLGVYDFESSALQHMAQTGNFSQSKLYDSLLDNFALRQLEKNDKYRNATTEQKKAEEELFRLRLGMIALLMFLNDTTHKDIHNLNDELDTFELNSSTIQKENILGGFFFIHENKSVTEGEVERYNYEFLHKTFGEFLAADFMLRVTAKQYDIRSREKLASDTTFRFCFGYNWLHKHGNILNFLMEHCPTLITYPGDMATFIIENNIKKELKNLFNKGFQGFPVSDFIILKPHEVIDHLAIYSQNLVFLWRAVTGNRPKFSFELFDIHDSIANEPAETVKYEAQDRNELNKNKILWKRLCNLWSLAGNKFATAQLTEWLAIEEQPEQLLLVKAHAEVSNNFFDAASVACNDFEKTLSLFDLENSHGSTEEDLLTLIRGIIEKKPELQTIALDALLYRLSNRSHLDGPAVLDWLRNQQLTKNQSLKFVQMVIEHRQSLPFHLKYQVFAMHKNHLNIGIILREILRDIEAYPTDFRNGEMLEILNDILSSGARENIFHHDADAELVLNYVLILKKLDIGWVTEPRLHKGWYEDLFHNLTRDMHHRRRSPRDIPTYLRALSEMQKLQPFNGRMRIKYFDEILHDLSNEIYELVSHEPLLALEYLKATSLINSNFKVKSGFHKKILSALQELSDNTDFFMANDVSVTLSFFRAINELSASGTAKIRVNTHLIEEAVYRIFRQFDYNSRHGTWKFSDYIDLLKEFIRYAPRGRFIHDLQLNETLDRFYSEFRHIARESSLFNMEFLKFVLDLKSLGLGDVHQLDYIVRDMTEFFLHEINYIGKQLPSSVSDFLVCLLEHINGLEFHQNPALPDLIQEVGKLKLSRNVRKKIALLLIKQQVNPPLLASYLEPFPTLAQLYYNNHELAEQLSAFLQEINS